MTIDRLLRDLSPLLRMDSRDRWQPCSAQVFCNLSTLHDATGRVIDAHPTLARLGPVYPDGTRALATDYLALRDDWRTVLRDSGPVRPLIYGEAIEDGLDTWLQWWMFYPRNDTPMTFGRGAHDADWERFAVLTRGGAPILGLGAQHRDGEERPWPAVELHAGRPVIYPRWGTHAVAFERGWKWVGGSFDITNGGRQIDPVVEIITPEADPWTQWPGVWGDPKRFVVRGPVRRRSPAKLLQTVRTIHA
jgi:hypothetical protein